MTSLSLVSVCSSCLALIQAPKYRIDFLCPAFLVFPCRSCREWWGGMWHWPGEAKYWGALWLCETCPPERHPRDDVWCPAQSSHSHSQTLSEPGCQLDAEKREIPEHLTKRYWLCFKIQTCSFVSFWLFLNHIYRTNTSFPVAGVDHFMWQKVVLQPFYWLVRAGLCSY